MPNTGITLLLDLYDCQSSALKNDAILEQLFTSALQFGGLEVVDQIGQQLPDQHTTHIFLLKESHATIHTWQENGRVVVDVYAIGSPETVRPALEIIRGFLTQKLIARAAQAQLIERGA